MIVFLIDADNLCASAWIEEAFQKLEEAEGGISVRRAYGSAEKLKGMSSVLHARAIRPFANLSMSKNTTDVALAVDAMELSWQLPMPTTVVIGSGDADFVPLVVRLRERGIRMVCVSEPGKMSPEAEHWYDQVILVGRESASHEMSSPSSELSGPTASLAPSPAKKVVAKKVSAKKVAKKNAPSKKTAAKKTVAAVKGKEADVAVKIEVQHILAAVPTLKTGRPQPLGDVVKLLHDAKLLGKNATSTKFFKKYPGWFELTPDKQPNKVKLLNGL
ncbi:NYN domain-containing protein [Polaromonas sp.]|uniref:NYN domain-containing protein n=1 Tax=Polaromonas sp. TaxID=1869339 RepID=UPI002489CFA6|nr:NYN domain-containing protein [Polaromonas sp.]MDI1272975.1 NYN domain-containing protein [Polaromonas sp.]